MKENAHDAKKEPMMGTLITFWNSSGREAYCDEIRFDTTDENELAKLWWDFCMEECIIDDTRTVNIEPKEGEA